MKKLNKNEMKRVKGGDGMGMDPDSTGRQVFNAVTDPVGTLS